MARYLICLLGAALIIAVLASPAAAARRFRGGFSGQWQRSVDRPQRPLRTPPPPPVDRFQRDPSWFTPEMYPQWYGGFHGRHLQNYGYPPGDIGIRGTAW